MSLVVNSCANQTRELSKKQLAAIKCLVENWRWEEQQVAAEIGVHRNTICNWRNKEKWPEFDAAYHPELADWEASMMSEGYANRTRRLQMLKKHLDSLYVLQTARAEAYGSGSKSAIGGA